MAVVELFQTFCLLKFRMDNETLDYIYKSEYISYFVFEELDQYRSYYDSFSQEDFAMNLKLVMHS